MALRLAHLFRFRDILVLLFTLAFALLLVAAPVHAASLPSGFSQTLIANGLSSPTAFAFAPDGRIFVTEQSGAVRVIKNNVLQGTAFVTVTTDSSGERGLLGIALDPAFNTDLAKQFVYIYYTVPGSPPHNRVSRFMASGDVAAGNETVLLDLENLSASNHNGGAIHFGGDGKLYVAVGENANPANAQTLNNRLGKILRINSDGSIPDDNPFNDTATGNNQAIWAMGLRNPFTFTFQQTTGRMFINDVGQSTWEEINDGIAGSNYGWNTCEGFCSPPNASFRDPLLAYPHSNGTFTGCSIIGAAFYNPTTVLFPANYVGDYFFADFCSGWIRRYDIATNTSLGFASGLSSPVDLYVSPDGALDHLARGVGQVWRVTYSSTPTNTRTVTPTRTVTKTATRTTTATRTVTRTRTRTGTATRTVTKTRTRTGTPVNTATNTPTRKPTRTNTPVNTATNTPTKKPTRTPTSTPTNTRRPTATFTPDGAWIYCAKEGQTCSFTGTRQVRYGANGTYKVKTFTDGVLCSNTNFGDPVPGVPKRCHYQ